jgi:hypothetical protein
MSSSRKARQLRAFDRIADHVHDDGILGEQRQRQLQVGLTLGVHQRLHDREGAGLGPVRARRTDRCGKGEDGRQGQTTRRKS